MNVNLKRSIPRRRFLQGSAALISLPMLGAMTPAYTAERPRPRRAVFVYVPHGMVMTDMVDWWTPTGSDSSFELSRTLRPLESHRQHLTVVSNLSGEGTSAQHAGAAAAWLTGTAPATVAQAGLACEKSLDQQIADRIAGDTPIKSLQIGMEDTSRLWGFAHCGYRCDYLTALSWSAPNCAMPLELQARALFERMFGQGSVSERLKRVASRRSVLDAVRDDRRSLERALPADDRAVLGSYLESVKAVEESIASLERRQLANEALPSHSERVTVMFDLMHLAFQADLTRVATFMMARELSNQSYPEIGVSEPHHALSHHQNSPEAMEKLATVNRHQVSLFGEFVRKLADTREAEGSLLDSTFAMYGSGMSDANVHSTKRLPIAIMSGLVRGNRHLVLPETGRSIRDLHAGIAELFDADLTRCRHGGNRLDLTVV